MQNGNNWKKIINQLYKNQTFDYTLFDTLPILAVSYIWAKTHTNCDALEDAESKKYLATMTFKNKGPSPLQSGLNDRRTLYGNMPRHFSQFYCADYKLVCDEYETCLAKSEH